MSDEFDLLDELMDLHDSDPSNDQKFDRKTMIRAPFGMPGAKFFSLERLLPHLPVTPKSMWVDHFGGSGIVSWNVPLCANMIYNDRYSGVCNFYRVVRERPEELIQYLEMMPNHSREEWFYCKNTWVTEKDELVRAAKWYYMVRLSVIGKGQCFGRGIELKATGMQISPFLEVIRKLSYRLKVFTLENLDWRVMCNDYNRPHAVHYMDPPYIGTDTGLYEHKFKREDLLELLATIPQLSGFVALSHYDNEDIAEQSYWDYHVTWQVPVNSETNTENTKGKSDRMHMNDPKMVTEHLWIKEPN